LYKKNRENPDIPAVKMDNMISSVNALRNSLLEEEILDRLLRKERANKGVPGVQLLEKNLMDVFKRAQDIPKRDMPAAFRPGRFLRKRLEEFVPR